MYSCDHCKVNPAPICKIEFVKPSHKRGITESVAVSEKRQNIRIVDPQDWYNSFYSAVPTACLFTSVPVGHDAVGIAGRPLSVSSKNLVECSDVNSDAPGHDVDAVSSASRPLSVPRTLLDVNSVEAAEESEPSAEDIVLKIPDIDPLELPPTIQG